MVIHGIAFFGAGWWGLGNRNRGVESGGAGLPAKALSFCCLTESSDRQGR